MTPTKPHIGEEQLAALIEGNFEGAEALAAKEHLVGCRTCMAAYADVVRLRQNWRRKAVAPVPAPTPLPVPRSRRPRRGLWVMAACVPLLLLGGVWFLLSDSGGTPGELNPAISYVVEAVNDASHFNMVLPGSGRAQWETGHIYRSENFNAPGLTDSLNVLLEIPDQEIPKKFPYLKAAGAVADRNLPLAKNLVDNELDAGSRDPDLFLLKAAVEFQLGETEVSEDYLNKSLQMRPDNPEALFNLAYLMENAGRMDEARQIFVKLETLEDYPLIRGRAEAELENNFPQDP